MENVKKVDADGKKHWYLLGFTRLQLKSIWNDLHDENLVLLRNIGALSATIYFLFTPYLIFWEKRTGLGFVALALGTFSVVFSVVASTLYKKNRESLKWNILKMILLHTYMYLTEGWSLYIDILMDNNLSASLFFVTLVFLHITFSASHFENLASLMVSLVAFIMLEYNIKPHDIFLHDLFVSIVAMSVSLLGSIEICRLRIKLRLEKRSLFSANRQLYNMSIQDPLTKLYNREKFTEIALNTLGEREKTPFPLALAIIDIDDFKTYNEIHGHAKGDATLRRIANEIKQFSVSHEMKVCRWAGEEFMLLFQPQTSEQAQSLLQQAIDSIHNLRIPYRAISAQKYLTVSSAIHVMAGKHTESWDEFYHTTYELLLRAKKKGPNSTEFSIN